MTSLGLGFEEMNGTQCTVIAWDGGAEKWLIELPGGAKARLVAANLAHGLATGNYVIKWGHHIYVQHHREKLGLVKIEKRLGYTMSCFICKLLEYAAEYTTTGSRRALCILLHI